MYNKIVTSQYKKITSTGRLLGGIAVLAIITFYVCSAQASRSAPEAVQLILHPAKSSEPGEKYQLLPEVEALTDMDAAPLYEKAVQSLPGDLKMDEIEQWLKTPPDKLPLKKVQSTLQQLESSMELLEQAARCKRCEWPYLYDDELSENLREHRRLLFFLALRMRFQIAQGRYDDAIGTAQSGFAMAKHLGDDPALIRGLVGIGIAAHICRQLEQFIQGPCAPNLYQALLDLPQPLVDLTKQVEWEEPDIKGKVYMLMNRLNRHVAVLQCIEAIRLYAGSHDGKFPEMLSDITDIKIPVDPVTKKPFSYKSTDSDAVLALEAVEGSDGRDAVRYKLKLK
jgi:tetratricopeptide (TPR) repeat protein